MKAVLVLGTAAVVFTLIALFGCASVPPPALDAQYKIKLVKGDTHWSKHEINHLAWALSRLTPGELAVLSGYEFTRWTSRESRLKADPTSTPTSECAAHEIDFETDTAEISIYDGCLSDACWYEDCFYPDIPVMGWLMSRYNILHEIGHAMAAAEGRATYSTLQKIVAEYDETADEANKAINGYNKAVAEADNLITEFNAADPDEQQVLEPKVKEAIAEVDRLNTKLEELKKKAEASEEKLRQAEQDMQAPQDQAPSGFESLIAGKEPLTGYSATSTAEAFAEAFAVFKVDPKHIKKVNEPLYDWFKSQRYLWPLKPGSAN